MAAICFPEKLSFNLKTFRASEGLVTKKAGCSDPAFQVVERSLYST